MLEVKAKPSVWTFGLDAFTSLQLTSDHLTLKGSSTLKKLLPKINMYDK